MQIDELNADDRRALDEVAGYLNFSAGATDRQFLSSLNQLYRTCNAAADAARQAPFRREPWRELAGLLQTRLSELELKADTFRNIRQSLEVLDLVHSHVLAAYREFHQDLLCHQRDAKLFGPFFLGRVYEAALRQRSRENAGSRSPQALAAEIVTELNDFIGHRPVATLETQKIEPYPHEWHRPVPLYVRGVGAAAGPYEPLVSRAIAILEATPPALLEQFHFNPQLMDELALDARAYDFDHPANKRPNYQFGEWDPHHIDNQGRYRRFVVRQVALDALLRRLREPSEVPCEERLFEAAAALCGTILMASEISGAGPNTHSSEVTLASLLPGIAAHRDRFYEDLLARDVPGRERLLAEAAARRQPFGAVRQHLNAELARRRAAQLEHVHLARLYARMGEPGAAARQAGAVSTPRARMVCQIQCLMSTAQLALDRGEVGAAARGLDVVVGLVHRGIECGAIVDPWNIIGFDANFSLFPALENSVHDHRIGELLELMEQIFAVFARTWTLSAAADDAETEQRVARAMDGLASWWDQFAAPTVGSVEAVAGSPQVRAAQAAAAALSAWHRGGTTAGDVAFWQPYAEQFDSPKAFVLVIHALLDKGDFIASMALLMRWLNHARRVELQEGSDWFHVVAGRWLCQLLDGPGESAAEANAKGAGLASPASAGQFDQRWRLATKFFDYLEANAEEYWQPPHLELDRLLGTPDALADDDETDDGAAELFDAAYDGMVYRDSTDDGVDTNVLGSGSTATDYELEQESKRIADRLAFLVTLARLWRRVAEWLLAGGAATQPMATGGSSTHPTAAETNPAATIDERPGERLTQWLSQVLANRTQLVELLSAVSRHRIPQPGGALESLLEYDRRRWIKDSLTERIISACVACSETAQFLLSAGARCQIDQLGAAHRAAAEVLRAALASDAPALCAVWPKFIESLDRQPLLYVPLAKGGDPERIVAARSLQRTLRLLLGLLPRLGLFAESAELLRRAAELERSQTVLPGAVTEFDQLLKAANQALAECLVVSNAQWPTIAPPGAPDDPAEAELIDALESLAQAMLSQWLAHSRTLRLSVLEKIAAEPQWQELVAFIRQFGGDLFVQQFLNVGNLRAILHRGLEAWLLDTERGEGEFQDVRLFESLRAGTAPPRATELLQLVLEAIVENYAEYRDFNSTTTQSDRGELLYMLLDLLRLRAQYDRIDWNVAPVAQIHEVLVRHGRAAAAERWRHELAERTEEIAGQLLARLDALEREYGMRLPTVADRLHERFVRPLVIDRARVLVRPAIEELRGGGPSTAFEKLEQEIDEISPEPTGVGLDVPAWLEALEDEAEQARWSDFRHGLSEETLLKIPQRPLTRGEVEAQLERLRQDGEQK